MAFRWKVEDKWTIGSQSSPPSNILSTQVDAHQLDSVVKDELCGFYPRSILTYITAGRGVFDFMFFSHRL